MPASPIDGPPDPTRRWHNLLRPLWSSGLEPRTQIPAPPPPSWALRGGPCRTDPSSTGRPCPLEGAEVASFALPSVPGRVTGIEDVAAARRPTMRGEALAQSSHSCSIACNSREPSGTESRVIFVARGFDRPSNSAVVLGLDPSATAPDDRLILTGPRVLCGWPRLAGALLRAGKAWSLAIMGPAWRRWSRRPLARPGLRGGAGRHADQCEPAAPLISGRGRADGDLPLNERRVGTRRVTGLTASAKRRRAGPSRSGSAAAQPADTTGGPGCVRPEATPAGRWHRWSDRRSAPRRAAARPWRRSGPRRTGAGSRHPPDGWRAR